MLEKLKPLKLKFEEIEKKVSNIDLIKNQNEYKKLMREYGQLKEINEKIKLYEKVIKEIKDNLEILEAEENLDMQELIKKDLEELKEREEKLISQIKILLLPQDEGDFKNIIMEIRAGTGGEEAALFASNLYSMYAKYCEKNKWKIELINFNETELKGFKEVVFAISGKEVFKKLKYESGVHRVQRIPLTESNGRLQTSAATVAVLPEIEERDIEINEKDLKIDTYRASGAGGQHVNTTDSAIRITHIPSGIVVQCQNERSQHKNKDIAMKILRARIYEFEESKKRKERAIERKEQVGSGDRSGRIRTYNFPQNRITDHRVNITIYKLEQVMQGELDLLLEPLNLAIQEEKIKELKL